MYTTKLRVSLVALVLLAVASCSSSPDVRYYTLKATVPLAAKAGTSGLALGIGPVSIPTHLEQTRIVTDAPGHEVRIADHVEWVDQLDESMVQVLGENISRLVGTERVYRYPWNTDVALDYQVQFTVVRLGGMLGEFATLELRWSVLDASGSELVRRRSSCERALSGSDYSSMASAVSDMLAQVSRDIARAIPGATAWPPVNAAAPQAGEASTGH